MGNVFIIDSVRSWFRHRGRAKRLQLAQSWPLTTGEINLYKIVPADEDANSFATANQIEAAFHFKVNGEYFGGYVRSIGMTHHEAEFLAKGNPPIHIRYDPTNPDSVAVLAEDNPNNLPFRIISN
jgi:hypothetical protein